MKSSEHSVIPEDFETPWDRGIVETVFGGEYGALDFTGKTVLDIGGHIGSFAVLAARGGAARVVTYEPSSKNFRVLQRNCEYYETIECRNAALWGNNGGETLILRERARGEVPWETGCNGVLDGSIFKDHGEEVQAVAFDSIVEELGHIDILKIDCEGSEYPILFTSTRLSDVAEIVGEWHCFGPEHRPQKLVTFLRKQGFKASLHYHTVGRTRYREAGPLWAHRTKRAGRHPLRQLG